MKPQHELRNGSTAESHVAQAKGRNNMGTAHDPQAEESRMRVERSESVS